MAVILVALFALAAATSTAAQATNDTRTPFRQPPWVIAHRGDAGELPEHTAQAYRQGIMQASITKLVAGETVFSILQCWVAGESVFWILQCSATGMGCEVVLTYSSTFLGCLHSSLA